MEEVKYSGKFPFLYFQLARENGPSAFVLQTDPKSMKEQRSEGAPTQVFLPVDHGVVVHAAAAVPVHGFYVIRVISCMDGSLKLTLKHRTVAGGISFTWKKHVQGSKGRNH